MGKIRIWQAFSCNFKKKNNQVIIRRFVTLKCYMAKRHVWMFRFHHCLFGFFFVRSDFFVWRCSVSICGFVWIQELNINMLPPDCRKCINLHHLRKSQTSLPKKSTAFYTPSVSWTLTWTGSELEFIPKSVWTTCAFIARILLSKILIGILTFFRSVDTTQFQLFHPSLEDMAKAEKLFCSSSSHKIDYYTSAERMDHVPALKAPEVSETLFFYPFKLFKFLKNIHLLHELKQWISR